LDDACEKLKELNYVLVSMMNEAAFVQVGYPSSIGGDGFKEECVELFKQVWNTLSGTVQKGKRSSNGEMKKQLDKVNYLAIERMPFKFKPKYEDKHKTLKLPGITASYLIQMVPCDVFITQEGKHHPDYHALVLLVQLLSVNEGPLYTSIRGRGLAYDASMSIYLFNQQLVFEVFDATDSEKALEQFHLILKNLDCGKFKENDILNARMSIVHSMLSGRTSVNGILSKCFTASIAGFSSLSQVDDMKPLFAVAAEDLERVYRKYLIKFLSPRTRLTVSVHPQ
jgi:Zn-dependent M16 (insulinase) family peptidase